MISSDTVATQVQLNVNYYVSLISLTILYYDHALTLSMEIQRFWIRGPFSWPALFFFLNRYITCLGHIPVVLETFWAPSDLQHKFTTCRLMLIYHQYLVIIIQFIVGVLLIMRVYAMYDRRKWVIWLFIVIACSDITVACWGIVSNAPIALNELAHAAPGCSEPLGSVQGVHFAIAWSGQLIFDAICFFLTLRKSISMSRTGQRTLINTLLRDGAVYFAIMTAANLANILTFLLAAPLAKGVTATFVNIISAIMMSRLMLNLRDPKILTSISRRTTTLTTASSRYMVSTYLNPNKILTKVNEESERGIVSPTD